MGETQMKNLLLKSVYVVIISILAGTFAYADVKIKTKVTMGGGFSTESTTYFKGERERSEANMMGMSTITITQCDLKRTIQINDKVRKYLITPLDEAPVDTGETRTVTAGESGTTQVTKTRKGGIVTFTVNVQDTGERKEMFGYTARHIKMTMSSESSPDACNPSKMRMETDGWYINFQYNFQCSKDKPPIPRQALQSRPECMDTIRFKSTGGNANPGYPVILTTTIYGGEGQQGMTMSQEVIDLSNTTLDAALFDIPEGYTEAKSRQEMVSMPSLGGRIQDVMRQGGGTEVGVVGQTSQGGTVTKQRGGILIGVAQINNKAGSQIPADFMRANLMHDLSVSNVEAIPLDGPDYAGEAKQKGCDFILYTDLAELKKPSSKARIGGMLGRMGGVGGGSGKTEARVDFKLVPTGGSTPQLQSSETGKEEGQEEAAVFAALSLEATDVVKAVGQK